MASDRTKTLTRLIGYWRFIALEQRYPGRSAEAAARLEQLRQFGLRLPDPSVFVDPQWNGKQREDLARYLEMGTLVNQYRGISNCRVCGRANGSAELTDGAYCWPEGLAHYVREHHVRLPQAVIDHARRLLPRLQQLPRPRFDETGNRDRDWPPPAFRQLLWTPPPQEDDRFGLFVDADAEWWIEQTG